MKKFFILFFVHSIFFNDSDGNILLFLNNVTQSSDYYQITSFTSDNFTKTSVRKMSVFHETPNKICSFNTNIDLNTISYDNASVNALKIMYSLQGSLIVFYTSSLSETKSFIDYLVPQLSVRQRPKCLIVYSSSNNFNQDDEVDMICALKCAWETKFLDFTVVLTSFDQKTIYYYYNPFNDVVSKKGLDKDIDVFPDKVKNAHGYPFKFTKMYNSSSVHIKRPHRKMKIEFRREFAIDYASKILNLSQVIHYDYKYPFSPDYLKKWNLDVAPQGVFDRNYMTHFFIPNVNKRARNVVAYVPISLIIYNFTIVSVMILMCFHLLN